MSKLFRSSERLAGVLVPLFSIPSGESWGIGEFPDITILGRWLCACGHRLLQLLPINEMPPGEGSPYGALSAMALDPQFIALRDVEDWAACGGDGALDPERRTRLDAVRASARVEYQAVRKLKLGALRIAFARFLEAEWTRGTERAHAFSMYCDRQSWWLDKYALFRALRNRQPRALAAAREGQAGEIRFRQYVQWVADTQWRAARRATASLALLGDLPFMVSLDSADGQDWGSPVYRWDVVEAREFEWLRQRARRHVDLYDGYRVDHLVGFYRTYARPRDGGQPYFTPADQAAQEALGEHVLGVFLESGARIIVEDLGTVPDFIRASLSRLSVPGYKALRWERRRKESGEPFIDPADYPAVAVATTGTHDNEAMVTWWRDAPPPERAAVLAVPSIRDRLVGSARDAAAASERLTPACRLAILEALYASLAELVILPLGDLWLVGARQRSGRDRRRELDVASAVVRRAPERRSRAQRAGAAPGRVGLRLWPLAKCRRAAALLHPRPGVLERDGAVEHRRVRA